MHQNPNYKPIPVPANPAGQLSPGHAYRSSAQLTEEQDDQVAQLCSQFGHTDYYKVGQVLLMLTIKGDNLAQ